MSKFNLDKLREIAEPRKLTRAEKLALEIFPKNSLEFLRTGRDFNGYRRQGFIKGYEKAEKDIIAIIESNISEIVGDAQPRPALRAELQELIEQIKDGKD